MGLIEKAEVARRAVIAIGKEIDGLPTAPVGGVGGEGGGLDLMLLQEEVRRLRTDRERVDPLISGEFL